MHRSLLRAAVALLSVAVVSTPATAQAPIEGMISLDSLLNIPIETAAKYEQTQRSAPASTVVVTSEEIARFGYETLGEVLASLPGFYGSNDRNYFYLGVRGFSRPTDYNNRILLLLDGHPLNENIYDGAYIGTAFGLDLETIDRIEVVRGPGSALYGSSAMFAVVNVIPKRANDVDGVRISGGAGSFGTQSGSAIFGRTLPSGLEVTVSGSLLRSDGQSHYYREFDAPGSNGGLAQDLDGDEVYSGYASLAWNGLSVAGFLASRRKDVPTAPWETVFNEVTSTQDERAFGEIRVDRPLSDRATLFARAFVDTYYYHGDYPYSADDGGDYSDESHGRWFGGEARLLWDMVSWNRLTVGGEVRRHTHAEHRAWADAGDNFNGDFPFTVLSAYVQDELQVARDVALTLGLRVDDSSTSGAELSPRAAAVYHPRATSSIKLLYGEAFRAPNLYEFQYAEDGYWLRNPRLVPERIRTLELAWEERVADGLFATVSLYDYRVRDLIDQTWDDVEEVGQYENVGAVEARGFEATLVMRLASGIAGSASYAFQDARDRSDDAELTNSPAHLARARLSVPLSRGLSVAGSASYDHGRLTVYGTRTDAYLVANVTLTTRSLGDRIRASLSVRNVFDASYKTPGGFEHVQDGIAQDGRSFRLKMSVLF